MKSKFFIRKNDWDTAFFKEKIGILNYSGTQNISKITLSELLEKALISGEKQGYKYIVLTDSKDQRKLIEVLTEKGFELCDSSVDFKMKLSLKKIHSLDDNSINSSLVKFAKRSYLKDLKDISEKAFTRSRLYKINFVNKKEVDKYHFTWVKNLFESKDSNIFVIKDKGKIMGFLGFTMNLKDKCSRIVLIATRSSARGKGYGSLLINVYFKYAYEKGIKTLFVKTQKENAGARKFYLKNGYYEFLFEKKYHSYLN